MIKKYLFYALIFCLFTIPVFSQTTHETSYSVKGVLVDSISGETIPYGTVSVASTTKSDVFLKRVASDINGNFNLVLKESNEYLFCFESAGMKKLTKKILICADQNKLNLGKIKMLFSNIKLSEITISAIKPLVKVDLDKISYDIKSDPESQSSMVIDMLRKVPMVTVDAEDKIQLKGSSNFKIYMNGKPSGLMKNNSSQILKNLPASSIKNIEVITEPGAKYDAEGIGGIINIVTDHSITGLTGTVRASVNSKGGSNDGFYISSKKGKFGLTTNLNCNYQHDPNQIWLSEMENFNSVSTKYVSQKLYSDSKYRSYYGNLEASYEFDSLNLVSLSISGVNGRISNIDDGSAYTLNINRDTLTAIKQLSQSQNGWGAIEMSLDYQRSFKKSNKLFTLSYKLSRTPDNSNNYLVLTDLLNYSRYNQHIQYNANGDENTFQIDYTEPLHKIHVIDFGAKYIFRLNTSENIYWLQNKSTLAWEAMPNQPTNNLYQTQNILGLYGSYTLKLNKFSISTGLRYEQTGSNIILSDTNFHLNFKNLVPSISLAYKFTESTYLRLSYNQRISRPGIWYLNPFVNNSNPFSIYQGNPNLKPENVNSFSLNYSYIIPKVSLITSLFTSFTNNSIERVSKLLNDSVINNTFKNIGLRQNTGLSVYGNWQPIKTIKVNLNGNLEHISMSTNDGSGLNNKGIDFSVSIGSQCILPFKILYNINVDYYSPRIELQGQNSGYYNYSMSLSRDFLNKELNISISARSPFNKKSVYTSYKQTENCYLDYLASYDIRSFRLSLNYRFGDLKNKIKKIERTITNDDVKTGGGQGSGGK